MNRFDLFYVIKYVEICVKSRIDNDFNTFLEHSLNFNTNYFKLLLFNKCNFFLINTF